MPRLYQRHSITSAYLALFTLRSRLFAAENGKLAPAMKRKVGKIVSC